MLQEERDTVVLELEKLDAQLKQVNQYNQAIVNKLRDHANLTANESEALDQDI